jgi:hypothetical protein
LKGLEGRRRRLGGQPLLKLREVGDFPVFSKFAVSDPVELKRRKVDAIADLALMSPKLFSCVPRNLRRTMALLASESDIADPC